MSTEAIESPTAIRDTDGNPIRPGRYMLVSQSVDVCQVDVIEDQLTTDLIVTVENLPLEPARYRLTEIRPGGQLRRLPDDYPRDASDLF